MTHPLNSPAALARLLIGLGYEPDDVAAVLQSRWPECAAEVRVADAVEFHARANREVEAAIARDGEAAVAAEHDMSKSMHGRG